MSKFTTFLSTTSVDEAIIDFLRTGLSTAIAVSLGLGIPLLDISGGDFRTVLSAALAAGLQVLQVYLDGSNDRYGLTTKPKK
jgi:hypothetical protein